MLNCPCGFGKNLTEEFDKCPVCGMNLEPLKKIAHAEAQMHQLKKERLKEFRQNKLLKKIIVVAPMLILIFVATAGLILLNQEKHPDLPLELSIELISAELEKILGGFELPEDTGVGVSYSDDVIEISGDVPTAFHKDIITALAIEKAGTKRINISNLNIIPLQDEELAILEDKDENADMELQVVLHYRVVPGDSLSKIARIFYGDSYKWGRIFDANQDQLSDYNNINVGQILKIPMELNNVSVLNKAE